MAGMERTTRNEKRGLGLKISEGKKHLIFEAYKLIAMHLYKSGASEDIETRFMFLLEWNLMKRAENVVHAKISEIEWRDDCLVFRFAKSKGHQRGEEHLGPWHVYANPENPHLCLLLAFSQYALCNPHILKGGGVPLFQGTNSKTVYARYMARFNNVVTKELVRDLRALGYEPGDLASHSTRKGVGTWVCSGCTVSPPIVAVCLRAGWTLGGVKDRYLFREGAGDQYVGRAAAGLDQLSKEFAVSPAYFDFSQLDTTETFRMKRVISDFIQSRLGFQPPGTVQPLIRHFLASICYHYDDLLMDIHQQSPLRSAALFRDIPDEIRRLATVRYPWNKTSDTPKFTGLPPHVVQLAELHTLKEEVTNMREGMMKDFREEMDKRGFNSSENNTQQILDLITEVTTTQTNAIVTRIIERTNLCERSLVAAVNQTAEDYGTAEMEIEEELEEELPPDATRAESQELNRRRREASQRAVARRKYRVGMIKTGNGCKLTTLPAGYKFPPLTIPQLIDNWLIGSVGANVIPLCQLKNNDVNHIKGASVALRKMRRVMSMVHKTAKQKGCWPSGHAFDTPRHWTYAKTKELWLGIEQEFLVRHMKGKPQAKYTTVYNKLQGQRAFSSGDEDVDIDDNT